MLLLQLVIFALVLVQGSFGEDACGGGCLSYCFSIEPGTVQAACDQDGSACICTNAHNQPMRVSFIPQRRPIPLTTTTTTTTPPPSPTFDYVPTGPVPVLLDCDGGYSANALCNDFCTLQIYAINGECDTIERTCRCTGVPASVVQAAPIAAIFEPPAVITTPPPPPQMAQWTPITQGHPYYYQNLQPLYEQPNGYYHQQTAPMTFIQPPQFYFPQNWNPIVDHQTPTGVGNAPLVAREEELTPPDAHGTSTEISSSVSVEESVVEEEGQQQQQQQPQGDAVDDMENHKII